MFSLMYILLSGVCAFSKNNFSEHVVEHTDMPSHLIKTVSGEQVFEQTQPRVINTKINDQTVNE